MFQDLGFLDQIFKFNPNDNAYNYLDNQMLDIYTILNNGENFNFTNDLLIKYIDFLVYADANENQFQLIIKYINNSNINLIDFDTFKLIMIYLPFNVVITYNLFGLLQESWLIYFFNNINRDEPFSDFKKFTFNNQDDNDEVYINTIIVGDKYYPTEEEFNNFYNTTPNGNFTEFLTSKQYESTSKPVSPNIFKNPNDLLEQFLIMESVRIPQESNSPFQADIFLASRKITLNKYYLLNSQIFTNNIPDVSDLNYACYLGNLKLIKHLYENYNFGYSLSFLLNTVRSVSLTNNLDALKYMIEKGNEKGYKVNPLALYVAAFIENVDAFNYLLNIGLDIHVENNALFKILPKNKSLVILKLILSIEDVKENILLGLFYRSIEADNYLFVEFLHDRLSRIDYEYCIKMLFKYNSSDNYKISIYLIRKYMIKKNGFISLNLEQLNPAGLDEMYIFMKPYFTEKKSALDKSFSLILIEKMYLFVSDMGNIESMEYIINIIKDTSITKQALKNAVINNNNISINFLYKKYRETDHYPHRRFYLEIDSLQYAIKNRNLDLIINILLEIPEYLKVDEDYFTYSHGNNKNYLLHSVECGDLKIIEYIYDSYVYANPNSLKNVNLLLNRPLNLSIINNRLDILQFFAEKGANIHNYMDGGILYATQNKYYEIVKYLIFFEEYIYKWNSYTLCKCRNIADDEIFELFVNLINEINELYFL